MLAPLRHPLLLARELGTLDLISEGRLVVQPSVSWSRDEYAALGVPFAERGRILDEQLAVMDLVFRESPASHHGRYFDFDDIYLEPKALPARRVRGCGSAGRPHTVRSCSGWCATGMASTR